IGDLPVNIRVVAPPEMFGRGPTRNVGEKPALISGQQVDVPVEGDAEACTRLLLGRLTVGEVHGEIATPGELAIDRRVVLDRMADHETDSWSHVSLVSRRFRLGRER